MSLGILFTQAFTTCTLSTLYFYTFNCLIDDMVVWKYQHYIFIFRNYKMRKILCINICPIE